jgi:hypothetical protein
MRAVVVTVANIISEQTPQVAPVQSDHVIQQVTPAALNPTLRNSILPRTPQRSADALDFHRSDRSGDLRPILGVTIEDDEPWSRPKWKRFSQLLDGPHTRRMPVDVDVQDAPPIMADHEKAVKHAERNRWRGEEVHRGNRFPLVSKEGEPTFGRVGISRRPAHPARDRSLGEIKTEREKFPVYPGRSPGWILGNYPEDHISNLPRNSSPACWFSDPGDQAPVETEACPMPSNHRLRRDDDQSFFPGGPELMDSDPEGFVEQIEPWAPMSTFQNGELLPKREILQHKLPMATKKANEYSEPEKKQIEHGPELYRNRGRIRQ